MTVINKTRRFVAALSVFTATASSFNLAQAGGSDTWFTPLENSAPVTATNSVEELSAPWVLPTGILQYNLMSMKEVEDAFLSPGQSVVRVPAGNSSSMFDMIAYDDTGLFLFIPHETPFGAGVSRFDLVTRTNEVLFEGDGTGSWAGDFGAFDPCRFTPNGTLFLGEEWTGEGRLIEVLDPFADVSDGPLSIADSEVRELQSIANVAHEGINFSEKYNKVIYYVDEWNSGSIYKFVMKRRNNYTVGQTFVLVVDDFISTGGVPEDNWDEQAPGVARTGMATWVPITNRNGVPLRGITDPFRNGPTNDPRSNTDTRGGRPAADDVNGTPYGRPEDMEVGKLRNGNEVVYFCATSERAVYSIEILRNNKAKVGILVNDTDTPKNKGFNPTTAELNSPDNLAQDCLGNIYVIEDAPNGSSTGGDIWFVRDRNNDGVGESLDHFMSLRVAGSEATGMIWSPSDPTEFVVAVQHPNSTGLGVGAGLGDAVWAFDIASVPNKRFVRNLQKAKIKAKFHDWSWGRHGDDD